MSQVSEHVLTVESFSYTTMLFYIISRRCALLDNTLIIYPSTTELDPTHWASGFLGLNLYYHILYISSIREAIGMVNWKGTIYINFHTSFLFSRGKYCSTSIQNLFGELNFYKKQNMESS